MNNHAAAATLSRVLSRRAMARVARDGAFVVFVAVSASCSSDHTQPVAPSPPAPPPPVIVRPFPPLSGATTTYRFSKPLSYPVRAFTEGSSFVLFESGGFHLLYPNVAPYRGGYEREGERIILYFDERDHTPDAIGTLNGDLLEVRYSDRMEQSDFENAVYQRLE